MNEDIYVQIPLFSRYSISRDGIILDNSKKVIVVPTCNKNHDMVVNLKNDRQNWCSSLVARLVLLTFKPLQEHEHASASVSYCDGNKQHTGIENLKWNFSTYKPFRVPFKEERKHDFIRVYGHSNYLINAFGIMTNRRGEIIHGSKDINGYVRVRIKNDEGLENNTSIHRLVALTFLEHPIDVTNFIVNHKDGNITNNDFTNLEWCTYTHNIDHAYDNEMRSQNIPVLVMNIETRRVMSYYSLRSCCHKLSIPHGGIWWRLRNERHLTPYHGYYIKYLNDERPWPIRGQTQEHYTTVDIVTKDLKTGLVEHYNSYGKLMRRFNIQKNSILYQLNKKQPEPYKGVLMKHNNEEPWPVYTEDELQKYELKTSPHSKPIRVLDINTGETTDYSGPREFCKVIDYKAEMNLRKKIQIGEPFRNYQIAYL
jgi:hypothetical protein